MDVASSVIIEIAFSVYKEEEERNISLAFVLLSEHSSLSVLQISELFEMDYSDVYQKYKKLKKELNIPEITWRNARSVEKYRAAKSIILNYMLVKMKENH